MQVPEGVHGTLSALTVDVASLVPYGRNPRRGDVSKIVESLQVNGQYRPIVVRSGTNEVLAGNHTLAAVRELGWGQVAATFVDCDDERAARIVLVDNRSNDVAGYDDSALLALLQSMPDLSGTGYDAAAVADLLDSLTDLPPTLDDPDAVPDVPVQPVTVTGDVWVLGRHRIMCGDCRDASVVSSALAGWEINVAFTSPPYADARAYDASSGFEPIPPDEYEAWFDAVQANVWARLADDGSWFVNIKAKANGLDTPLYVHDLVIAHVRKWGWHYATEFCWERIGMPKSVTRRFKNQFEPVYQFTKGDWKMRPDSVMHESSAAVRPLGPGAGQTSWADVTAGHRNRALGGDRTYDGMAYPGNRLPPFQTETTGHTAAFPVGLPAWFVRAFSDPGDVVFDPFMGSGTTLIAAHREDRTAIGIELSPAYCDVICRRYQEATGDKPVLESTGEPHDFTQEG